MLTEIRKIDGNSLIIAKQLINRGELVAFPTETVYGLGANAFDKTAVGRIFVAKGRPSDNPLIVHIADFDMIDKIAVDISSEARKVISALMPGSITIVLKKRNTIPYEVTAGLDTVGIRMPLSEEARQFIAACGVPIAAPSANTSTRPSPTTYQAVYEDMNGKIPLILAGQDCMVGIESTVLSMVDEPIILRPGIVTPSIIEGVLGKPIKTLTNPHGKVASPGVKYSHYAPSCPAVLCDNNDINKVSDYYDKLVAEGHNPVIMCLDRYGKDFAGKNIYSIGNSDVEVAKYLFNALRVCEKKYDYIIEMFMPTSEIGRSVMNRMTKSVGGKFI